VPTKKTIFTQVTQEFGMRICHYVAKISTSTTSVLLQYLISAYRVVAWYTAAMHLLICWMWMLVGWIDPG